MNFAFIDSNNVNKAIEGLGWKIDWIRFRVYLKEKYNVSKACLFIGYIPDNSDLYSSLQEAGFILIFKPTYRRPDGKIKGNVDAELVLQAMCEYKNYQQAVIVTGDGDFACLIRYLYKRNKLCCLLAPDSNKCSALLKESAKDKLRVMNDLKNKLEYKKRRAQP
jgi:uncharacterized LabA/DUF88 family protein